MGQPAVRGGGRGRRGHQGGARKDRGRRGGGGGAQGGRTTTRAGGGNTDRGRRFLRRGDQGCGAYMGDSYLAEQGGRGSNGDGG